MKITQDFFLLLLPDSLVLHISLRLGFGITNTDIIKAWVKEKVVPEHGMKAYRGSRSIILLILTLSTKQE